MNSLYDVLSNQKGKERVLSAEELLTMFNRNILNNAELLGYIGRTNFFGIIGKARNEGVHSRFVSELLSGDFFKGDSRESSLMHFMDLLLYRSAKEEKGAEVNEHLKKGILTRSVLFECEKSVCELSVKDYQKRYGGGNKGVVKKDDRIDIYLRYKLNHSVAGRNSLEVFIENKVNSLEFDSQTLRYYKACCNGGFKRPFQLFVFLTPQPIRDMDRYLELDSKMCPECPHYIHICYQDILDYIIEPLMSDESLDADKKAMLKEYVSCLELPAMPDADTKLPNTLSIMAISTKEKDLVFSFMEDAINRRLINKAIEAKLGEPLYSVATKGHLFNATEAMEQALVVLADRIKPLALLKKVASCGIVGPQKGANPYLVYSPNGWRDSENRFCRYLPFDNLYMYSGKVYGTVGLALSAAIKDFKEKGHKTKEDLAKAFSGIYSLKGGGTPLVSVKKEKVNVKTEMDGVFIREDVSAERLPDINAILGEQFMVKPIDNESYEALMRCNVQIYHDEPVVENGLPNEIEGLIQDVNGRCSYKQVGETPFFFRKDILDDRILKINKIELFEECNLIEKCKDTSLLLEFFDRRKNLILSVYKILLEAETDREVCKEKLAVYRKLLKL